MQRLQLPLLVATVSLGAAGFGIYRVAEAQNPTPPPPPGGGNQFRPGPPRDRLHHIGGPAQMVVSGNNLFILRGPEVLRLNAQTLQVEAKGELPPPPAPPYMEGPGGEPVRRPLSANPRTDAKDKTARKS